MRSGIRLLLLAAPLLMAACATSGGSGGRKIEGETVTIQVRNDLRPQAEVTLRIASSNGVRRILATVPPGGSRTVTFDEPSFSGQYRLVAEAASGQQMESRPFHLFPGAQVSWTLFNNTLSVAEP